MPPPPLPELETETPSQTWEEPTTVQPPTWDDEPHVKPPTSTTDAYTSISEAIEAAQPESQPPTQQHETNATTATEPPTPEPVGKMSLSASKSEPPAQTALTTPTLPQVATATPSPKLVARPAAVPHRSNARHKTTDQPVVMPSSFGAGVEKVGMQFGSLGLGGESILDSTS